MSGEIIEQVNHPGWKERQKAAEELGSQTDQAAQNTLCEMLSDKEKEVWTTAERSLGKIITPYSARKLAYSARLRLIKDPKTSLAVILPFKIMETRYTAQGSHSSGSFSYQMPRLCIYCGKLVAEGEVVPVKLPSSSAKLQFQSGKLQAPCCADHRAEVQRNQKIGNVVFFASLLLAIAAAWFLIPVLFADLSALARIIFGLIIATFGAYLFSGSLYSLTAGILGRLSPSYTSLRHSPSPFDAGCIGLSLVAGESRLYFRFTNPEFGAEFYALNPHTELFI